MRTKDELFELEEIPILLQYLYKDENARLVVNNTLTDLELRMDEDFEIWAKNLKYPHLPDWRYTENMHPQCILGIIDQLKTRPAEKFPHTFKNLWDEIKTTTLADLSLNRKH